MAEPAASSFVQRIGAALVAPRAALAASDSERGQGRAPGDLVLLLALGFAAQQTAAIVSAGWMALEGAVGAAVGVLVQLAGRDLAPPLLLLLASAAALAVLAGRRRRPGADFDLACVAFVPAVVVHIAAALVERLGAGGAWLRVGTSALAYGWAAAVLVLAWQQTRARDRETG